MFNKGLFCSQKEAPNCHVNFSSKRGNFPLLEIPKALEKQKCSAVSRTDWTLGAVGS
jgi:hypothetical protein